MRGVRVVLAGLLVLALLAAGGWVATAYAPLVPGSLNGHDATHLQPRGAASGIVTGEP